MVEEIPQKKHQKQQRNPQQQKQGKVKKDDAIKINELGLMDVGRSKIMLFHRPTHKTVPHLISLKGCTMIVTVQAARE